MCAQAKGWRGQGLEPLRIAINVSRWQLLDSHLEQTLQAALHENGLRLGEEMRLELEVTVTVLQSMERSAAVLHRLRAMGVQIAVDDFGTGYSSLSLLKHLPIDTVKVEQLFVQNIPGDTDGAAITRAVITMAHALELQVIAEGVETDGLLAFLRAVGCDEIQGILLATAIPAAAMAPLLQARHQPPRLARLG